MELPHAVRKEKINSFPFKAIQIGFVLCVRRTQRDFIMLQVSLRCQTNVK